VSLTATTATWAIIPELRSRVAELPNAKRRPSADRVVMVALLLADRYRDDRGYTDETVPQICTVLALPDSAVRGILAALHDLGYWIRESAGNRHAGARRRPTFLPVERGADPALYPDAHDRVTGVGSGADPALYTEPGPVDNNLERGVAHPRARGSDTYSAGSAPRLPCSPTSPSSSSCELGDRATTDDDPATVDRARAACAVIGAADHQRAVDDGVHIRTSRTAHRAGCIETATRVWLGDVALAAEQHPELTAEQLAEHVVPGCTGAPIAPARHGPAPPRPARLTEDTAVIDLADNGAPVIDLTAHRNRTTGAAATP
jgi:hypothetical protein